MFLLSALFSFTDLSHLFLLVFNLLFFVSLCSPSTTFLHFIHFLSLSSFSISNSLNFALFSCMNSLSFFFSLLFSRSDISFCFHIFVSTHDNLSLSVDAILECLKCIAQMTFFELENTICPNQ